MNLNLIWRKNKMMDIQNQQDNRMPINKVGIKEIYFPLIITDKINHIQNTVAKATISVNLSKEVRGTHMSRFVEVINEITKQKISMNDLSKLLENIKNKLGAKAAYLEIEFKYFIKKYAPVSKKESIIDYDCKFICSFNGEFKKTLVVTVPVTTLCPCSKAISLEGAHNQRSFVTVSIETEEFIWIEDIISLTESKASCEIYSLLKRADEKYITEKAYKNPRFVEDMVREVAITLKNDKRIKEFSVFSEHLESIHNHNAFALIEYKKDEQK